MIDIHCHLLPGIDDGSRDVEMSIQMARRAVEDGIDTIVATPHVSNAHRNDPATLAGRCADLQQALDATGVPLRVHTGAEVSIAVIQDLDEEALRQCGLGGSRYLLLEPPLNGPVPFLDRLVFDLTVRGFQIVLAHPERIAAFQKDLAFLEKLVGQGALCSVTAASITGRFGRPVRKMTEEMFARGLVHNLASDAHDPSRRPPALRALLADAVAELPELEASLDWLTVDVPRAIVANEPVRGEAPRIEGSRGLFGRLRRR